MDVDVETDKNTKIATTTTTATTTKTVDVDVDASTTNTTKNTKPIQSSNVLIELENTLNNYEIDYKQLEKKKGPLIIDLSEEGQITNQNDSKPDTNTIENQETSQNDDENELFKSTSTFNIPNASRDSLFQSQDSIFNKTQHPLIIELDSTNNGNEATSNMMNISTDTPKNDNVEKITSSETNKIPRLDENVEWIEKLPVVKSLDGSIPINKVTNELKPSDNENKMQVDEEKLDEFFKFTEEENRMMANLPNIECK